MNHSTPSLSRLGKCGDVTTYWRHYISVEIYNVIKYSLAAYSSCFYHMRCWQKTWINIILCFIKRRTNNTIVFLNSSSHKLNPHWYSFTNKQTKEKTVIARHQGYPTIPPPTSFRLHVAFRLQARSTHCVTTQFTTAHVVYVTAWPLSVSWIPI